MSPAVPLGVKPADPSRLVSHRRDGPGTTPASRSYTWHSHGETDSFASIFLLFRRGRPDRRYRPLLSPEAPIAKTDRKRDGQRAEQDEDHITGQTHPLE